LERLGHIRVIADNVIEELPLPQFAFANANILSWIDS
jgi:hypothetical protein